MGIVIRIILLLIALVSAVMWYNSESFLWWGLSCVVSAVLFFISLGVDISDIFLFLD